MSGPGVTATTGVAGRVTTTPLVACTQSLVAPLEETARTEKVGVEPPARPVIVVLVPVTVPYPWTS